MAQSLLFWDYFGRVFFLPQILYPGRRSGQTMFCNSFLLCSSHGLQRISHSGLTTYNITVLLQRWLIARCHPHSPQQCFITHVEEPKGWWAELPPFFGAELTQKALKRGLHPCALLIISNLFCYSIFSIKPTDVMATVLIAYTESCSSVCFFPSKRCLKIN